MHTHSVSAPTAEMGEEEKSKTKTKRKQEINVRATEATTRKTAFEFFSLFPTHHKLQPAKN